MALERNWEVVPPQLFTANGTQFGLITLADTAGFKVKQSAYLKGTSLPNLAVQVKRVLSPTQLVVGPINNNIASWIPLDISAYTVLLGASIGAEEQKKNGITPEDITKAIYESDPTVALRSVQVDQYGQFLNSIRDINGLNRLAVDAAVSVAITTIDLDAFTKIPADNVIAVGTEDGTKTGIKHATKIDSQGNVNVINMGALVPKVFDDIDITYSVISGQTVATLIEYYTGGPTGTLVATLTLSYDGSANLIRAQRS